MQCIAQILLIYYHFLKHIFSDRVNTCVSVGNIITQLLYLLNHNNMLLILVTSEKNLPKTQQWEIYNALGAI